MWHDFTTLRDLTKCTTGYLGYPTFRRQCRTINLSSQDVLNATKWLYMRVVTWALFHCFHWSPWHGLSAFVRMLTFRGSQKRLMLTLVGIWQPFRDPLTHFLTTLKITNTKGSPEHTMDCTERRYATHKPECRHAKCISLPSTSCKMYILKYNHFHTLSLQYIHTRR